MLFYFFNAYFVIFERDSASGGGAEREREGDTETEGRLHS